MKISPIFNTIDFIGFLKRRLYKGLGCRFESSKTPKIFLATTMSDPLKRGQFKRKGSSGRPSISSWWLYSTQLNNMAHQNRKLPKNRGKKWKILETMRHLDFFSEYVVHFKQQIWNKTRLLSKDWNNIPFQNIPFPLHPWRLTAGTCPHGCLVQINFLSFHGWFVGWMIIFQDVNTATPQPVLGPVWVVIPLIPLRLPTASSTKATNLQRNLTRIQDCLEISWDWIH